MKTIMHKNCMDVAFMISKLRRFKTGHYHLKGQWINLGYTGNPWPASTTETIVVPTKEYEEDWIDITGKIGIVRTKPGVPELDEKI